ncbi:prolyl oligopeptidase family serine peptidase [Marinitenerispora sediminis]|uniref:prolyl oligopeptidase n=1 Tax=Marinitenerispora sediminis TaxID=1931232 RepID=A0A368T9S8_9ACTN|nr:prolyl oligopeptidase family serine peptidase [Marinitenerispora sediminis]RCV53829.1 S9 family peptidase [Marinitenerispora sediminis]RCV58229.1 S9 family peptidase [Marinitenerispora sediminis]RCV61475.1 S9 family peptidase [Marinitenerispora sediminis]
MPHRRYPAAERLPLIENLHGHDVADPYRWLEEAGGRPTKEWADGQDALFSEIAAALPGREWFGAQVQELMGAGFVGAPVWRGDRRFFTRRTADQEHGVLYTVEPSDGTERVLVDPTALDPSGATTLDSWRPDRAGRLLAYQISEGGDEESRLRIMDVATGTVVDGPIDRCRYSPIAWLPDGEAFYYVRRLPPGEVPEGEEQYHRRVYLHRVGTPVDDDVLVFGDGRDKTEYYGVSVSRDGRWLLLTATKGTASRNDAWIADLHETGPETPRLNAIQEGVDAEVSPYVGRDGRLYLFTDRDAPRGRLCVTEPHRPEYRHWRPLVETDPDAVLSDFAILDGAELDTPLLLAGWRRHAVSEVTVHELATGARRGTVPLPGLGSVGGLVERPEGGHEAWFTYTDNTTPVQVYRYDARSGEVSQWAVAPGSVPRPDVRTEQVAYTSRDGTTVRMLVISPPDPAPGPRPTILYGYGGFSVSLTPGFSATALAWVRAGGVYAVANLRGGLEEGEQWHRGGMLGNKQNVFDDCTAAAEHLIATGVTTADRLAVMGGSNGGLLVGAAVTQRPDLYAAAVCSAPLLDMVRYERFGLGQLWNVEYGSAEDPEALAWLLAYSPYHNVREGVRYPATLFTVFDNDTRVDPLHARKTCAALQYATSADPEERPIVLRREAEVGHSARSVSRSVRLSADQLAFLARHTGLEVPAE